MRLIDADALIKLIEKVKDSFLYTGFFNIYNEFRIAEGFINSAPTVKLKSGKWIVEEDIFGIDYKCSICGKYALYKECSNDEICSEFCPHCGAKMGVDE